jgi:hypothetical protein
MDPTLYDLDADWPRLWALAGRLGERAAGGPDSAFFPLGLGLHGRDGGPGGYDATPVNSTTFASTGGDGVHFSLLHATDVPGAAPVVMTVPMQFDAPNHVVGASLREFLALGCRVGYYHLDHLAYGWGRQAEASLLQDGTWTGTGWDGETEESTALELLSALTRELGLAPWPNVAQRLAELQASYGPSIRQRGR